MTSNWERLRLSNITSHAVSLRPNQSASESSTLSMLGHDGFGSAWPKQRVSSFMFFQVLQPQQLSPSIKKASHTHHQPQPDISTNVSPRCCIRLDLLHRLRLLLRHRLRHHNLRSYVRWPLQPSHHTLLRHLARLPLEKGPILHLLADLRRFHRWPFTHGHVPRTDLGVHGNSSGSRPYEYGLQRRTCQYSM